MKAWKPIISGHENDKIEDNEEEDIHTAWVQSRLQLAYTPTGSNEYAFRCCTSDMLAKPMVFDCGMAGTLLERMADTMVLTAASLLGV